MKDARKQNALDQLQSEGRRGKREGKKVGYTDDNRQG